MKAHVPYSLHKKASISTIIYTKITYIYDHNLLCPYGSDLE